MTTSTSADWLVHWRPPLDAAPSPSMPRVEYSILGPLTVRLAPGAEPIELADKPRLLLARLLVAPGTSVSESALANDVWGVDSDLRNPSNSVHRLVSQLRVRLGDDEKPRRIIVRDGAAYRLEADPVTIDAERFKMLARRGRALMARHPRAARAMLEEALAAWRGPPLADCDEHTWIGAAVSTLGAIRDEAQVDLNETLLRLGEYESLEGALRVQIVEHPTDERRRAQLIRALEQMGRDAEARLAYRSAIKALGAPGTELRRLGDRIGRGTRPDPPPSGPSEAGPTLRPGCVLLHAVLEQRERPPGKRGAGSAALLVDRAGGEPHTVEQNRLVAAFDDPRAAAAAASELAADLSLRCAVGLHSGGFVQLAGRLGGPGPSRCRVLAEAAHPGQVLVSAAARELGWDPSVLHDLGEQRYEDLLPGEQVFELTGEGLELRPPRTLGSQPHNLPVQQTRFVGRDRDLASMSRAVAAGELITLLGTGGCGKTRLALQLAARSMRGFEDGAWFAELAELPTGAGAHAVAVALAAQLSARALPDEPALAALVRHLSDRSALVVVDNCEHVIDACKEVIATVRAGCPRVCLIVTSREALRIDGERIIEVPAMSAVAGPEADVLPDAVELLLERAGSLPAHLTGGSDLLDDAVRICLALEGSPLAIELVAGHVPTRGLAGVAVEVEAMLRGERDLDLFGSDDPNRAPRQRTIEAAVRWSHDLLEPHVQRVLHRLSVFSGSFGVREAQLVATGEDLEAGEVSGVIARLVACSLVASEPPLAGRARVRLRQEVRTFARAQLERSGELELTRATHADVYRSLASEVAPTFFGPGEQEGIDRLEADHDNLRAALGFVVETGASEEALELAGAMWWLWFSHGHVEEGTEWVARVLELGCDATRGRVRVLRVGSHLTWWRGDYGETDRYNHELERCAGTIGDAWGLAWAPMGHGAVVVFSEPERALEMFEESRRRYLALGRDWEAGYALQLIAASLWYADRHRAAGEAYEEAVRVFERLGHGSVLASVRRGAGLMAARAGYRDHGRALCREALAFSESIGDRVGGAQALNFLAAISFEEGDLATAAERNADALSRAREVGDLWATCWALDGIAAVACGFLELELAARLLAHSDMLAARAGYQRPPDERRRREEEDAMLRAELGDRGLERTRAEGEHMTFADAVSSALAFARRLA